MRRLVCLLAIACGAAEAQQHLNVTFNVSIPGIPQTLLSKTGLNTTLLREKLALLATTTDVLFANAIVGDISRLLASDRVEATSCSAGTYSDPSSIWCVQCPMGTYSAENLASSIATCQQCPEGTYSGALGVNSLAGCTKCPAGKYSVTPGATSSDICYNCGAGKYSAEAASVCSKCAAGTYSAATNAGTIATCVDCGAGNYSAEAASVCSNCAAGTYSAAPNFP
jgi:hypothetical protein